MRDVDISAHWSPSLCRTLAGPARPDQVRHRAVPPRRISFRSRPLAVALTPAQSPRDDAAQDLGRAALDGELGGDFRVEGKPLAEPLGAGRAGLEECRQVP